MDCRDFVKIYGPYRRSTMRRPKYCFYADCEIKKNTIGLPDLLHYTAIPN